MGFIYMRMYIKHQSKNDIRIKKCNKLEMKIYWN